MNPEPDKFQQAWQAHSSQTRVTIDAELLLKVVQRSQGRFQAMIFWRDFREVGVALVMIPVWFFLGATMSLPWTWYLTVPVLLWIAGFLVVDRMRHKRQPSEPGEPLLANVQASLTEVEHQICLLRNIFWWYLLPPSISILSFFAQVAWQSSEKVGLVAGLVFFLIPSLFVAVVYAGIYFLNQYAVRAARAATPGVAGAAQVSAMRRPAR